MPRKRFYRKTHSQLRLQNKYQPAYKPKKQSNIIHDRYVVLYKLNDKVNITTIKGAYLYKAFKNKLEIEIISTYKAKTWLQYNRKLKAVRNDLIRYQKLHGKEEK